SLDYNCSNQNDPYPTLINYCLDENFIHLFNTFLRQSSIIEILSNEELKYENSLLILDLKEDIDTHLQKKFAASTSSEAQFFGNTVDSRALSRLLNISITWIKVDDSAVQPPQITCSYPSCEVKDGVSNREILEGFIEGIVILNRGPHCDLILSP
ncbi:MAG: hypothetical protein Q8K60_03330, partial [Parachlamydiaceae bacterium]|nr:hypothetical protein [Parachlamydiaceae bacterium]